MTTFLVSDSCHSTELTVCLWPKCAITVYTTATYCMSVTEVCYHCVHHCYILHECDRSVLSQCTPLLHTVCLWPKCAITVYTTATYCMYVTEVCYHCVHHCYILHVCDRSVLSPCTPLLHTACVWPRCAITVYTTATYCMSVTEVCYHRVHHCYILHVCDRSVLSLCIPLLHTVCQWPKCAINVYTTATYCMSVTEVCYQCVHHCYILHVCDRSVLSLCTPLPHTVTNKVDVVSKTSNQQNTFTFLSENIQRCLVECRCAHVYSYTTCLCLHYMFTPILHLYSYATCLLLYYTLTHIQHAYSYTTNLHLYYKFTPILQHCPTLHIYSYITQLYIYYTFTLYTTHLLLHNTFTPTLQIYPYTTHSLLHYTFTSIQHVCSYTTRLLLYYMLTITKHF